MKGSMTGIYFQDNWLLTAEDSPVHILARDALTHTASTGRPEEDFNLVLGKIQVKAWERKNV